ncbi:MAG: ribonuclease domain-containing protein [Treponemataceae bacterium]|nr:ribonuclease domain-containing protein [Treponemataceae bacterium]
MLKNKLKAIIPSLVVILGAIFGINLGINNQDVNLQESNVEAIVQEISEIQNEEISDQNLNEQKDNFSTEKTQHSKNNILEENKYYYSKDDVALYIHTYNRLPKNFITKKEARSLGWEGGSVEKFVQGKCIGGDRFYNNEEILPVKSGRTYTECDIDTLGKNSRGAKRIVFSNDGLIFYTENHYETFEEINFE